MTIGAVGRFRTLQLSAPRDPLCLLHNPALQMSVMIFQIANSQVIVRSKFIGSRHDFGLFRKRR